MMNVRVSINGIDGEMGEYLLSLPLAEIAAIARGDRPDRRRLRDLTRRARLAEQRHQREPDLGVAEDITGQSQLGAFESTIKRLLKGLPVGVAFEYFNDRYAAWATTLTSYLQQIDAGLVSDLADAELRLAEIWTARNDSRGYALLGDPAARLPVQDASATLPSTSESFWLA